MEKEKDLLSLFSYTHSVVYLSSPVLPLCNKIPRDFPVFINLSVYIYLPSNNS